MNLLHLNSKTLIKGTEIISTVDIAWYKSYFPFLKHQTILLFYILPVFMIKLGLVCNSFFYHRDQSFRELILKSLNTQCDDIKLLKNVK